MTMGQNQVNDGEGFNLNGERIEFLERDGGWKDCITFTYSDKYGLYATDEAGATHWRLCEDFAKRLVLRYLPGDDPNSVFGFFKDVDGKDDITNSICYTYWAGNPEDWEELYGRYVSLGLKPLADDVSQFKNVMVPIIRRYVEIIDELKAYSTDGRLFLIGDNTAVLSFWWEEYDVSPSQLFRIIYLLQEKYPRLKGVEFYIALAHKVVPVEEFTGDFEASDEDEGQIGKQREVHLMNYHDKHKALNPYLKKRARHQGQRLQMSNGDEMTQAEYNSYLHQESIKRMVKGVILEYLMLN